MGILFQTGMLLRHQVLHVLLVVLILAAAGIISDRVCARISILLVLFQTGDDSRIRHASLKSETCNQ